MITMATVVKTMAAVVKTMAAVVITMAAVMKTTTAVVKTTTAVVKTTTAAMTETMGTRGTTRKKSKKKSCKCFLLSRNNVQRDHAQSGKGDIRPVKSKQKNNLFLPSGVAASVYTFSF